MNVKFNPRFVKTSRAGANSELVLRERLSDKIKATQYNNVGASFVMRSVHPEVIASSYVKLVWPMEWSPPKDSAGNGIAGPWTYADSKFIGFPRCNGLLQAFSLITLSINGTQLTLRPDEIMDYMQILHNKSRGPNMDYRTQVSGGEYPFSGEARPWGTDSRYQEPEPGVALKFREFNPKVTSSSAQGAVGTVKYDFEAYIPIAPFAGVYSETFDALVGRASSEVLPHMNDVAIDVQWRPKNVMACLIQTPYSVGTSSNSGVNIPLNKALLENFWSKAEYGSGPVKVLLAKDGTSSGVPPADRLGLKLFQPFLEVEWYSHDPSVISIPAQISLPGQNFVNYQKEFSFTSGAADSQVVQFSALKFDRMPKAFIISAVPSRNGAQGWDRTGTQTIQVCAPIDYDTLELQVGVKQVMMRMSEQLAYENFLQAAPESCMSKRVWRENFGVCVCLPELFGQASGVYNPFQLSAKLSFKKPSHPQYAGHACDFTAQISAIYSTAISISESASSVADIRYSEQAYRQALMGQAGKGQAAGGVQAQG